MTISVWVMLSCFYTGMYVHDCVVLESMANEWAMKWISSEEKSAAKNWISEEKESIQSNLYIMRIKDIHMKKTTWETRVKISYQLPISLRFLRKILTGGNESCQYQTKRENINPAKVMWDSQLIRE